VEKYRAAVAIESKIKISFSIRAFSRGNRCLFATNAYTVHSNIFPRGKKSILHLKKQIARHEFSYWNAFDSGFQILSQSERDLHNRLLFEGGGFASHYTYA
jgi:hypothetical protein